MSTQVVFETATIASAVSKAERVAPDKGLSFDKAAGILIEVYPADEAVVVRSTNLEVFYMEFVDSLQISGENASWLLPSSVFAAYMSSLPIAGNKTVTFTSEGRRVKIEQGRSVATLNTIISDHYPDWQAFSEDDMTTVPELGGRLGQVEWAASKTEVALGVRFTGTHLAAMDRQRLAIAPLDMRGLEFEPFTIPPRTLTGVIRERGDTKLKREGTQLLILPDEHSQIRTVILGEQYPPLEKLMDRDREEKIKFNKTPVIEMIQRTMKIAKADRFPTLKVYIGREEIAAHMVDDEKGNIGDVVEIPGQAQHKRTEILFLPENILDALTNAPSEEVEIGYNTSSKRQLIYINGGSGYECWVTPRVAQQAKGD